MLQKVRQAFEPDSGANPAIESPSGHRIRTENDKKIRDKKITGPAVRDSITARRPCGWLRSSSPKCSCLFSSAAQRVAAFNDRICVHQCLFVAQSALRPA